MEKKFKMMSMAPEDIVLCCPHCEGIIELTLDTTTLVLLKEKGKK